MSPLALLFASGSFFYVGMVVCLLVPVLRMFVSGSVARPVLNVLMVVGVLLILLSGTPLAVMVYLLWGILGITALFIAGSEQGFKRQVQVVGVFAVLSIGLMLYDWTFRLERDIPYSPTDTLCVVGDSLSIGSREVGGNWPERLGKQLGLKTLNLSAGGKRIAGGLNNVAAIPTQDVVVIIELGGNDILGRTPVEAYAHDLEQLLEAVCIPGRTVAMFELPLPPFYNQYGRAQRALAREHGVILIPKTFLANILGTPGATVDGLHFSETGHAMMAEMVAGVFVLE